MAERKLRNEVPQESALTSLYVISWKSLTIGEGTFGNTNKEKHFADLIFFSLKRRTGPQYTKKLIPLKTRLIKYKEILKCKLKDNNLWD